MKYNVPIAEGDYPLALIKGLNCFLDLTDFELAIVSNMLKYNMETLSCENRKKIREVTGKGEHTTNNYIKKLKDKKILIQEDGKLSLAKGILIPFKDREITIKFNLPNEN